MNTKWKPGIFLLLLLVLAACGPADTVAPVATPSIYMPIVASDGPPVASNLLTNGDFELGSLDQWSVTGGVTSLNSGVHAGSWAARFDSASGGAATLEADVNTVVGTTYKVTGWLKIVKDEGSDWGGFRFTAISWDWNELASKSALVSSDYGTDWFKIAFSFTATTTQTRLQVGYFGGTGRTMEVYTDDIMLFAKGSNHLPYFSASLSPTSGSSVPLTQDFTLTGDDADGAIVHVSWDFGDGSRSLSASGSRRVGVPGTYVATVRAADDDGAVVSRTISWSISASGYPSLAISTPSDAESTVQSSALTVKGTASSASSVKISSDRGYAGTASGTSSWSAQVPLAAGQNRILVQATDSSGHVVMAERLVRYVPSGALAVSSVAESATSLERWDMLSVSFVLNNSAATNPQFPYDADPPPGLEWVDGVTVDALFTPDNWQTVYRRPAFLNQPYQRAEKGNEEWMYPSGSATWLARFAPPTIGAWKYRIEVTEAKGSATSDERSFQVVAPTSASNHGPVNVSATDSRYFEYADGKPFLGAGNNIGFDPALFSYDAISQLQTIGSGNQQILRWWMGGNIWTSAWQAWRSRTLTDDGYLPTTGLSLDSAYGNGLASLKLDASNPLMMQGWNTGHAGLVIGRTYRVRVRWRTDNVTGPSASDKPYGVTVKFVDWPTPGQTNDIAALIAHEHGDTPWHTAEADFVATTDLLPNLALILENTTGGAAYVDEVDMYEVQSGGSLGPQLLRGAQFNSHLTFDPKRGAAIEAILAAAQSYGITLKMVISEKNEYLLNHLGSDGLPSTLGGNFDNGDGSPTERLHEYYWRHLFARFGAYRSVHSWELVNEASPASLAHFSLAAKLATAASADGNPHMASTSTWATLAEDTWKNTISAPLSYVDFHVYVRNTGWLTPVEDLANDSARMFAEYDEEARAAGFGKPVVGGEIGIDSSSGAENEDPLIASDTQGVWLHKLLWARCGPGAVYPLYWYTDNIFDKSLHKVFGAWNTFMADVPITNGKYADIAATPSNTTLRVFGQKDVSSGAAYLWIDNSKDTWRAVVDGTTIAAQSGTVTFAMQQPSASYTVTWYNTSTGVSQSTQTVQADASGNVTLQVSNLSGDIAAKIAR